MLPKTLYYNGSDLVRVKSFGKSVCNNKLSEIEKNSPELYVFKSIEEDDCWAEYAFLPIPEKKNSFIDGMNAAMNLHPDEIELVVVTDKKGNTYNMIELWWD